MTSYTHNHKIKKAKFSLELKSRLRELHIRNNWYNFFLLDMIGL